MSEGAIPQIVGIMGRKRSGKDTIGAYLSREHGYVTTAFAAPLKEALFLMDPLVTDNGLRISDLVQTVGWEAAKSKPEVRRSLQRFGDAARFLQPDIFVRTLVDQLPGADAPDLRVVVTDVRRLNEARALAEVGAMLVRVRRPEVEDGDTHPSETEFMQYDGPVREILNSGTLAELYAAVDREVLRR